MSDERGDQDRGSGGLGLGALLTVVAAVLVGSVLLSAFLARVNRQRAAADRAMIQAHRMQFEAERARREAEIKTVALRTVVPAAAEKADAVKSRTVTLDGVEMKDYSYQNQNVGKIGLYVAGDTPASTKFVTGRFVLEPGKTPHAPHVHPEEEVMIVESGTGEIFCDGKTTKVGPGSVMYTVPNAPHGITNTGDTPLVFYFVKWEAKGDKK